MGSVSPYTEREIAEALTCHALAGGSKKNTRALLKERKLPMSLRTVETWAYDRKRELYRQILARVEEDRSTRLADVHYELAGVATKLERELLTEAEKRLKAGDLTGKELSDILRTVSTAGGIHTDKVLALTGRPTEIIKHDFSDLQHIIAKATEGKVAIKAGVQIQPTQPSAFDVEAIRRGELVEAE